MHAPPQSIIESFRSQSHVEILATELQVTAYAYNDTSIPHTKTNHLYQSNFCLSSQGSVSTIIYRSSRENVDRTVYPAILRTYSMLNCKLMYASALSCLQYSIKLQKTGTRQVLEKGLRSIVMQENARFKTELVSSFVPFCTTNNFTLNRRTKLPRSTVFATMLPLPAIQFQTNIWKSDSLILPKS